MVKARIERDDDGTHRIFVQRAKFKHWFELGVHKPTDAKFSSALAGHKVVWSDEVIRHDILFPKLPRAEKDEKQNGQD